MNVEILSILNICPANTLCVRISHPRLPDCASVLDRLRFGWPTKGRSQTDKCCKLPESGGRLISNLTSRAGLTPATAPLGNHYNANAEENASRLPSHLWKKRSPHMCACWPYSSINMYVPKKLTLYCKSPSACIPVRPELKPGLQLSERAKVMSPVMV